MKFLQATRLTLHTGRAGRQRPDERSRVDAGEVERGGLALLDLRPRGGGLLGDVGAILALVELVAPAEVLRPGVLLALRVRLLRRGRGDECSGREIVKIKRAREASRFQWTTGCVLLCVVEAGVVSSTAGRGATGAAAASGAAGGRRARGGVGRRRRARWTVEARGEVSSRTAVRRRVVGGVGWPRREGVGEEEENEDGTGKASGDGGRHCGRRAAAPRRAASRSGRTGRRSRRPSTAPPSSASGGRGTTPGRSGSTGRRRRGRR